MTPISCPQCAFTRSWKLRREKRKCKRCRSEFSARRYPVPGFHLTATEWRRIVSIFLEVRTVRRLARALGIGVRRAQRVAHHLRTVMTASRVGSFAGPVEIDETYVGAQRKNQRLHIRSLYPPKRGHGTQKLPIFGIFDRSSGRVFVEVMPQKLDVRHIMARTRQLVAPDARIFTDAWPAYRSIAPLGYRHEYVDHNQREYVRGDVHTNNIEGFWGILKRTMGCIGGMKRPRLYLFVGEVVWRFNHRTISTETKERALLELVLS